MSADLGSWRLREVAVWYLSCGCVRLAETADAAFDGCPNGHAGAHLVGRDQRMMRAKVPLP